MLPSHFLPVEMEREGRSLPRRRSSRWGVCVDHPRVPSAHFMHGDSRAHEAGQPALVTWPRAGLNQAFLKVTPSQPCSEGQARQATGEQETQLHLLQGLRTLCMLFQSWQSPLHCRHLLHSSDHSHLGRMGCAEHPNWGEDTGLLAACPVLVWPSLTSKAAAPWGMSQAGVLLPLWPPGAPICPCSRTGSDLCRDEVLAPSFCPSSPSCKCSLACLHGPIKYSYPSTAWMV